MRHLAAYLMLQLGGNASPSADDVTAALAAVGVAADADSLARLMAGLEGKSVEELMEAGKEMLATFGGGGGGGGGGAAAGGGDAGGGAAAAKEEEKEEEVEMDLGGGMDMFGGEEGGGGGGDY